MSVVWSSPPFPKGLRSEAVYLFVRLVHIL